MMSRLIQTLNEIVWGIPTVIFFLGTHLFFTIQTGFIQRKIATAISLLCKNENGRMGMMRPKEIFSAVFASTLGTGSIVGISAALVVGGPGALFWCWVTGMLGAATRYAETLLAVKFRVKDQDGKIKGGPMYVMEKGLNKKWMAKWYAAVGAVAAFGIGCSIQVNAIANVIDANVQIALDGTDNLFSDIMERYPWAAKIVVGVMVALLAALVILGGIKSIAGFCGRILPFMIICYVSGCAAILVMNHEWILKACQVIVKDAFGGVDAAAGGIVGTGIISALRYGTMRGLFSSEAGLGMNGIVEAKTKSGNPVRQGMLSSLGTFLDTAVLCTMTGLVLMTSILKEGMPIRGISEVEVITNVFGQLPYIGRGALVVGIMTFAFTTILGWSYYGEQCAQYLLGKKTKEIYQVMWIAVLVTAPIFHMQVLRDFSDLLNILLAVPNLTAILMLSPIVRRETKYYLSYPDERERSILDEHRKGGTPSNMD